MAGWALGVSIASLVVAIGAVVVTWYLWRRSGPEIVVIVRKIPGGDAWRGVEVINSGRMPVVIRQVGVLIREPEREGSSQIRSTTKIGLDVHPKYPVTIPPTGYLFAWWSREHGFNPDVYGGRAQGYAVRGDGRRFYSTVEDFAED
jgi:hypothetical protein